jgi:uncharacterized protein
MILPRAGLVRLLVTRSAVVPVSTPAQAIHESAQAGSRLPLRPPQFEHLPHADLHQLFKALHALLEPGFEQIRSLFCAAILAVKPRFRSIHARFRPVHANLRRSLPFRDAAQNGPNLVDLSPYFHFHMAQYNSSKQWHRHSCLCAFPPTKPHRQESLCHTKYVLTDLVQIRTLGEKKRPENERFRRYMKSHDHSDRRLRRMAEEIEEQIDCSVCANCCRVATVKISERDVDRLVSHLGMRREEFLAEYTAQSDSEGRILRRTEEAGCAFLDGNSCTVYEGRPETCQRFPHMVRGNGSIASRMWEFIDRACYCPIVYNSLETFKADMGFTK